MYKVKEIFSNRAKYPAKEAQRVPVEDEEEDVSIDVSVQYKKQALFKTKSVWLLVIVTFCLLSVLSAFKLGFINEQCNKRPFSLNPPYDDVFYFNLYNHWQNTTCKPVPLDYINWFKRLWGSSPHKEDTIKIRDLYFDQINKTSVIVQDASNKLLIGISSAATDFQRRQLVRTHQIKPFNNSIYGITWKFVTFVPSLKYMQDIIYENETYGDLIILNSFNDTREASRQYKPYEFFKYVEKNMNTYKYVAKLDTDCYLNVKEFWNNYFNETVQELDYGMIGLFIEQLGKLVWPMGAFEAISWKTMLLVNRLYESVNFTDEAEDLQLGWYLYDAELNYTRVAFSPDVAYDFRAGCNPSWLSDVFPHSVRIHELKTEQDYINVASCFNSNGVNMSIVENRRLTNWTG